MKFASSFAVLGALASIASAFVAPNEPIGNTIWKPNTQVSINWRDDGVAPALSTKPTFDISFMTGSNLAMVKLATIATNITGDTTSFTWTVPYVSPPGQIYFLQFDTVAGSKTPGLAWSTRFTITDADGNAPAIPPTSPIFSGNGTIIAAPTTAAPTGKVAATGSATGSAANPSATAAGKNGAGSLAASAMTVAAAVGAAALMAL